MSGLGETPDGLTAHGPESSVAAFCEQEHLEYRLCCVQEGERNREP